MPEIKPNQAQYTNHTKAVFNNLSPAYINFCLSYSGQSAADLEQNFSYAELGSGWGLSIAGWAAIFPKGRFIAIEPNSEQSDWTGKLAKTASLDNLTVLNRNFDQLIDENIPQLDYLIINGTYSRTGSEGRQFIRDFIKKHLKPGGVAYISYNSQPGWSVTEPLKEFLMTALRVAGGEQSTVTVMQGLNSLKNIQEAGSLYFKNAAGAGHWLEAVTNGVSPETILDELINHEQRAFAFSEILDDMSEAGLSYIGSLDISNYLDNLITPKAFLDCINQVAGSLVLRETVKGLLYNTTFRSDLFIKSPKAVDKAKAEESIRSKKLMLCGEKAKMPEKVNIRGVETKPKTEIYDPIIEVLAERPLTVGELMEKVGLDTAQTAQAAAVLLLMNWIYPTPPDYSKERSDRIKQFNLTLEEVLGAETFNHVLSVFGNWRGLSSLERLYVLATLKGLNPETFILEVCGKRGWKVLKANEEITDPEIAHQVVSEQLKKIKEASWLPKRFWGEE